MKPGAHRDELGVNREGANFGKVGTYKYGR